MKGAGFQSGATIGLTFAVAGYIFAFFVGVPLVNRRLRSNPLKPDARLLSREITTGIMAPNGKFPSAGKIKIHGGNSDSLAFQAALMGLVYFLTYQTMRGLSILLPGEVGEMIWGFFFFLGLLIALGVKQVMHQMGIYYLVDSGIQRRITGWSIDYLIVATVAGIQIALVSHYWLPLLVMSLGSGIATTGLVLYLGSRLKQYSLERTAAIYGTVTGTVSCGLLLLRMADPDFKTPVPLEIGLMNVFAVPIIMGCTVLVNAPLWWHWSIAATVLIYGSIGAICLGLIRLITRKT